MAGFCRARAMPILLFRCVSNRDPCNWFVPDFVVMMAVAGVENCALELSVSIFTSCTASGSGNCACVEFPAPPKFRFCIGAPSWVYSSASPINPFARCPPASRPGVVAASSPKRLRPFWGSWSIRVRSNKLDTVALSAVTNWISLAVTVTASVTSPTANFGLRMALCAFSILKFV